MNLLKNILGLVSNNWWLKIIALLLAIVIYHGLKSDQTKNQEHTNHDRTLLQLP